MDQKVAVEKDFKIKLPPHLIEKWQVKEGDQLLVRIEQNFLLVHPPNSQQTRPSALGFALQGPWFASVSADELARIAEEEQHRMAADEKGTP